MRLMSFRLTTAQFLDGSKDVTRRLGWANLKAGEHVMAVKQAQGLRKGEKVQRLGVCVCISNAPEELGELIRRPVRRIIDPNRWFQMAKKCQYYRRDDRIFSPKGCLNPNRWHHPDGYNTPCLFHNCPGIESENAREGFPDLTPVEFVEMFCRNMKCSPDVVVNRIEFRRVCT